jgi:hypothetical protein
MLSAARGFLEFAVEEAFHAAPETGLFLVGAEDAREIFDLDHTCKSRLGLHGPSGDFQPGGAA